MDSRLAMGDICLEFGQHSGLHHQRDLVGGQGGQDLAEFTNRVWISPVDYHVALTRINSLDFRMADYCPALVEAADPSSVLPDQRLYHLEELEGDYQL